MNKSIQEVNDAVAHETRHSLSHQEVLCINVQGAPGCGKTSLIEELVPLLGPSATIQGDLESNIDKVRLEKQDIPTFQINTHSGCHLNAQMIKDALVNLSLDGKEYLFVENVGNLVCPAGVQLGQHVNITLSAVTEGSDKPKKYPIIFLDSKLIVITKYNLKDVVDFDEEQYLSDLKKLNPKAKIVLLGKHDTKGLSEIAHFFKHERQHLLGHAHSHTHTH
ncbi:MAG: hydrogenase nickel incorporation protein HypB [Nanoarchaeota archaeon]|nr:hydrogenase nickel incorporation protein HypB [Nanoarchaeota archaeon]